MKLEVGMYVRTKQGIIEKVIDKYEAPYGYKIVINEDFKFKHYEHNYIKYIVKASYNIIDLIEVGDYVNGFPVAYITDLGNEFGKRLSFGNENYVLSSKFNLDKIYIYEEDIKSIVTKEQFAAMQYKVGE